MKKRIVDRDLLDAVSQMPCSVCFKRGPNDPAHIKSRGSGGHDRPYNVVALCREHHSEQHTMGMMSFVKKYRIFRSKLSMMGWTFDDGKMWNEKINPALDDDPYPR
jgi:hypothetical protein